MIDGFQAVGLCRGELRNRGLAEEQVEALLARVGAMSDEPPRLAADEISAVFLDNIASVLLKVASGERFEREPVTSIGRDLDILADPGPPLHFIRDLNLAAMSFIRPTRTICAVATVRNEGAFLPEWLGHLEAIGVEHVFLYTNDNTDGSDDLLERLADSGVVTLARNLTGQRANPQVKAYDHLLNFVPAFRDFHWAMYLDADEFFVPSARYGHRVEALLADLVARVPDQRLASVSFNWIWMGSGGSRSARLDQPLSGRFRRGVPHSYVKSIVRPEAVLSMRGVHKPVLYKDWFGVNGNFQPIDMAGHETPFVDGAGEIFHFWHKSFEEFLVKQARGVDRAVWERDTELFFAWDNDENAPLYEMPDALVAAASEARRGLMSPPGIAEAHRKAVGGYGMLAERMRGDRSIDDCFLEAEIDARIRRALREPVGSWDGAAEVAALFGR